MPTRHSKTPHTVFICEKCKSPLNGMVNQGFAVEDLDGDEPEDGAMGSVTVCGYCGAVYRTEVSPAELKRGVPENWRRWPDDELPDELRELQLKYARGQIPLAPGASRRGNPS